MNYWPHIQKLLNTLEEEYDLTYVGTDRVELTIEGFIIDGSEEEILEWLLEYTNSPPLDLVDLIEGVL